ncbi:MAG: ATP-dependent protease La [Bacteroidetes bacterium]|nr:ATP-dependent protease La [Bacteroidota bacterium]
MKTLRNVRRSSPEVPSTNLRWRCTPAMIGVDRIEDVTPLEAIIGQDRALRALALGLDIQQNGYNIFVTGFSGTGRTTTIKRLLREVEGRPAQLTDKCYVHNFRDPDSPIMITLPAGKGMAFKKDMAGFLTELMKAIPAVFESRRYAEQRKDTLEHFQQRQRTVLREFEKRVRERGFEVVQVQAGGGTRPEIAPVFEGNPTSMEQLHARVDSGEITADDLKRMEAQHTELEKQMDLIMREMRNIERKAKKSLEDLNHRIIVPVVDESLEDLRQRYPIQRVQEYLNDVETDVLENLHRFQQREEPQQGILAFTAQREEEPFQEYQVNVIVDNTDTPGTPVIIESNPRFKNLFGTIERVVDRNGMLRSDFTRVKAGSMLKADGGFLVINAIDALTESGVWNTLKRVLRNRQLEIQAFDGGLFGVTTALKPEPIDINVKVIMVGDSQIYQLLFGLDEDFKKIFKVRADFDVEMSNDAKSIGSYVSFIKTLCEHEQLLPFEVSAAAEVIEYGARLAGQQKKLSTRFSVLADVLREASYWATRENATRVNGAHVRTAIRERIERVNMLEEKIQEMIMDGSIMIDTEARVVGQVNGLSVYQLAEHEFGRPSRITAKTSMGRAGIINIEREASMSGPTHNKGVLILSGYLRWMYAQDKPLVLSASLAFEQSYSGVDGDSASSTEIYALLSSLGGLPLRQDLAVTGSVNQHGEIQPIGGVNQKIEGFFDVCNARGLTGTQGVLIPKQNVQDLMLRHDVVEAVANKQFHVYAISSVDEGIELLTGKPAGTRKAGGLFTAGSVHARVDARLREFARKQKSFGR